MFSAPRSLRTMPYSYQRNRVFFFRQYVRQKIKLHVVLWSCNLHRNWLRVSHTDIESKLLKSLEALDIKLKVDLLRIMNFEVLQSEKYAPFFVPFTFHKKYNLSNSFDWLVTKCIINFIQFENFRGCFIVTLVLSS